MIIRILKYVEPVEASVHMIRKVRLILSQKNT